MNAIFLLGLGAQKAGTSWLHAHLAAHEHADMGFAKEYHALEGFFGQGEASPAFATLGAYAAHFAAAAARPSVRLVGDITPAYAALPAAALVATADAIRAQGLHPRALFLLRDPVERVWSAVRMVRAQGRLAAPVEADDVRLRYTRPAQVARGRYDLTMAAIEAAFAPEDIFYGLYETLFRREEMARLMAWLGLSAAAPDFTTRVNASPKTAALPRDLQVDIARLYAPAYAAARQRFGDAPIGRLWSSASLL